MASYAQRTIFVQNGAGWDALLARDFTPRFVEADYQRRDFTTGQEGAQSEDLFNKTAGADFTVDAAPGSAAGAAPAYDKLLTACGLKKTVAAGVSVSYTPQPMGEAMSEIVLSLRNGNVAQQVNNVRGALSFSAEVNRKAGFAFKMLGSQEAATAPIVAVPDFSSWPASIDCSPANMNAFTIGGVTLCVQSFSLSDGRSPMRGKFMNCGETSIVSRAVTGRAVVEWPVTATKDLLALVKAGTQEALVWELGKTAGKKVKITGPKVQFKYGGESNVDGTLALTLDLVFSPDQGDDEFAIIFS